MDGTTTTGNDEMVDRAEAAAILKCCKDTVRNYARRGRLIEHRVSPRIVLYRRSEVLSLAVPSPQVPAKTERSQ